MKRSAIKPGSKSLERGSTFSAEPKPLTRNAIHRDPRKQNDKRRISTLNPGRGFSASPKQQEKARTEPCVVTGDEALYGATVDRESAAEQGRMRSSVGGPAARQRPGPGTEGVTSMQRKRTCAQCGAEFVPNDEHVGRIRKYCSRECGWTAQKERAEQERPPRDEVERLFSEPGASDGTVARHYGKSQWWAKQLRIAYGIPAPRPSSPERTGAAIACDECGDEFYAKPSEIAKGKKYCSQKCMYARPRVPAEHYQRLSDKLTETRRGPANPAYKHGRDGNSPRRGTFGLQLKGEACCRNCGTTRNLGLHHALPRSLYRAGRDELLNGVPLCTWCHLGWHRKLVVLYRDIFTEEEWAYLSSADLLGQRVEAWLDDHYPDRGLPFRDPRDIVRTEAA